MNQSKTYSVILTEIRNGGCGNKKQLVIKRSPYKVQVSVLLTNQELTVSATPRETKNSGCRI